MWKLKLTYFYVKFFYLIFNKLWKPEKKKNLLDMYVIFRRIYPYSST